MKKMIPYFVGFFLLGWIAIGAIRFFTFTDPAVHYHANFQMYINDKLVDFTQSKYQEDVSQCAIPGTAMTPRQRAHLHNGNGGTVHVHTGGVTWGQFFQSLGFSIGDTYIVDDTGTMYAKSSALPLHFVLNGVEVLSVVDRTINSEDRLLISYGPLTSEGLAARLSSVPHDAATFNAGSDPATCSGTKPATLGDRLQASFLWN